MLEPSQTVYIGLRRGASCSCGSASRASPSSIPKSIIALGRSPYHCPKGRGGGSGRSARTRLTPGEEGGELRRPEDSLGQRTRHALDALHRSVNPPRTNARRRPGAIGMRSRPDREPARHRRRALWRDRHCRRLRLCRRSGTAGSRCAGMRPLQQCVPHRSVALRARGKVNRAPVFWRRRRSATTEADRLCRSERESIARVLKDARGEDYFAGLHSALLSC